MSINKVIEGPMGLRGMEDIERWDHSTKVKQLADSLSPDDLLELIDLVIKQGRLGVSDDDEQSWDLRLTVGYGIAYIHTVPASANDAG
tara:strand:- start:1595 stop:1858 length:264 start_codon:yes stop_codon:yes gene_type:complete